MSEAALAAAAAAFGPAGERMRRRMLGPGMRLWLWRTLPLAAFAGLRVAQLDTRSCRVRVPGGWRTQNPFRSTYFAAQAMAAELSTGAPAMVLVQDAPASVAMLVVGLDASYSRKLVGEGTFTFDDVAGMAGAVVRTAQTREPRLFTAHSVGRDAGGHTVAEFDVTWSFRSRTAA